MDGRFLCSTEFKCGIEKGSVLPWPAATKVGINQGRCYTESNAILRTQLQLHVLFNFPHCH